MGTTWACPPPAAALNAEDRPQRGLAQSNNRFFAEFTQTVGQAHSHCGLALTRRGGGNGRNQHQFAVRPAFHILEQLEINFSFVVAVKLHIPGVHTGGLGNFADIPQGSRLGDFNICFLGHTLSPCQQPCAFAAQDNGEAQ